MKGKEKITLGITQKLFDLCLGGLILMLVFVLVVSFLVLNAYIVV